MGDGSVNYLHKQSLPIIDRDLKLTNNDEYSNILSTRSRLLFWNKIDQIKVVLYQLTETEYKLNRNWAKIGSKNWIETE